MELYFIRHTKVKIKNDVCYGQSDVDITDITEYDISKLKKKIPLLSQMVFYTSPSKRCLFLTKKLAIINPIIDERLLELDFGDWELKKWDSINKSELQEWIKNFIHKPCPHGESYLDLYTRTSEFFEDLIKKNHEKVVIITHLGVIRSILSYILKIPLKNSFKSQLDYGNISKINVNHSKECSPIINIEFVNK